MRLIDLATEDQLSEAIGARLLTEAPGIRVGLHLRQNGNGYLRSRLKSFCAMARTRPILVITDLDTTHCPGLLRDNWFGQLRQPASLIFRIAVREIESWLLADHVGMIHLIGKTAASRLPRDPDMIADPKGLLLALAKRAPRGVRRDLCADPGSISRQGLGYNTRLCEFVRNNWNPELAASRSDSLRRARHRIQEIVTAMPSAT